MILQEAIFSVFINFVSSRQSFPHSNCRYFVCLNTPNRDRIAPLKRSLTGATTANEKTHATQ
jgi:hypothetical protein